MIANSSAAHERSRFVEDVLSYMTLDEKLGQLDLFHRPDDPALEQNIAAGRVGGVLDAKGPARLQTLATEHSRLGIPLLLARSPEPQELSPWALAAAWDETLAHAAGAAAAHAAIGHGFNALLAPGIAPDNTADDEAVQIAAREPHLTARLASAYARGAEGDGQDPRSAVLAVPGWRSAPNGDALAWSLGLVEAGGASAIACAALDPTAARRAGFSGLLVAECRRLLDLVSRQFDTTSARFAVEAAERAIEDGLVSEIEIDSAVRGVLAAKHAADLFRDPHRIVAPRPSVSTQGRDDLVRSTFVLLRNEAGLLPLSPVSDKVLVVGHAAGVGGACANALNRAGIGHSIAPGLAQRRDGESWDKPVSGDAFALSLTSDAARRADFTLVVLDDCHFAEAEGDRWRRPTAVVLDMLRGLSLAGARLAAIIATGVPVDLAESDQYFTAVLQCWRPVPGFEEALSDVLSGRSGPQGRMPANAGRYVFGHGLGFGESVISNYRLEAASQHLTATARISNSGAFAMRETIQIYARGEDRQLRLIAFNTVSLAPGEATTATFALGIEALGIVSDAGAKIIAPGPHEILLGKSMGRLLAATIDISPALARAMALREPSYLRLAAG